MIIDCYDIKTEPIVNIKDFYGEQKHIVDICLIIFSIDIHTHLLNTYQCEQIGLLTSCNGNTPIYKMNYKGKDIAFYLTGIGSALASTMCYETHWLTGATKFIMFGSCGSLDREKTEGKFIVPTESYRGEGASYYYAEPTDYLEIKNSKKLADIFEKLNVPYVTGRVWTTDSILRETAGLVSKLKAEGCIAVEMELAGVQALCDFYGLELYDFLEAGDVLESSGYDIEGLNDANHNLGKLYIALKTATLL
ncbi:MAG: nucleoside phosphorylase [Acutalibacteraceae bacterium]|nr:nucleoside phosphorylase [Acutalibacteraceae bacterium]